MSNLKTPALYKNDILSNMIQKFSEEAKKQFELSSFSKTNLLQEDDQKKKDDDNYHLEESAKQLMNEDKRFQLTNHSYNKIVSVNDFNNKKPSTNHNNGKNPSEICLQTIIQKKKENNLLMHLLKNISLTKWINTYSKLIDTNFQSIEEILKKLQSYTFEAKSTICEVKEVTVLDCIQIITVKDIRLNEKKIILTKNNGNHESEGDLINDYYLKEGDVFLCKNKFTYNSDFIRLNLNDIQR